MDTKLVEDMNNCNFSRGGRTDVGVSAFGQVVAAHLRSTVKEGLGLVRVGTDDTKLGDTELDYVKMLNGMLPWDIRVLGWAPVALDFSAR